MNTFTSNAKDIFEAKVSIVVVNYNAGDLLRLCIENCLPQCAEIIVVDNASVDNSLQVVSDEFLGVAKLQIIRNAENLGFAAACNLGANASTGDFILFLNPDCMAADGAVQRLAQELAKDSGAGMAGGLLLNPDGNEQAGGRRAIPTPWRSLVRAFHFSIFANRWPRLFSDFNLHKQPLPVAPTELEAISGACTMVKRVAMDNVGPWDEAYFLHCEDLDLCMRYRKNQWRILFVPDAKFVHYRGACSQSRPVFVEWHKHKGMFRFYDKFFRHQYPWGLMWLVALGVGLRFCAVLIQIQARRLISWFSP
jgi:GT2 family glycosyltransferase